MPHHCSLRARSATRLLGLVILLGPASPTTTLGPLSQAAGAQEVPREQAEEPGSAQAEPGVEWLVRIGADDPAAYPDLSRIPLAVLYRGDGFLLVRLAEPDIRRLAGVPYQVLDRGPLGAKAYYLVRVRPERSLEPLRRRSEVLHFDGRRAVIKAAPGEAQELAAEGFELAWISTSPKPWRRERPAPPARRETFSPLIDAALVQVSETSYLQYLQTLEDFGTRYTYAEFCDSAAYYLFDGFQDMGLEVEFHRYPIGPYEKLNVIATIPGEVYPEETVYITAHYDCISEDPYEFAPGADDNASGTAAVLETARVLRHLGFERTLKFACFSGEEQGLVGSQHYVADIHAAGENAVACFNLDMIAWSGTDPWPPDLVIYTDEASQALAQRWTEAALYYLPTEIEPRVKLQALEASDHASFWQYGYLAVLGIEEEAWGPDFNPYYHTTEDLVIHCDVPYAADVTRSALAAVADYAGPLSPTEPYLALAGVAFDDDALGPSSGNGNGVPEYGETIELTVTLTNLGLASATGTEASLLIHDPHTEVEVGHQSFGDIAPGDSATSAGSYVFTVEPDCPDLHELAFIMQPNYLPGSLPFSLTVHSPIISFYSYTVDDSAGGDGDGVPEPGEIVSLTVSLLNEGSAAAPGVAAALVSYDPPLEILPPAEQPYGDLEPGSVSRGTPFTVALSPVLPNPYTAVFSVRPAADRGYENEGVFYLWVGDLLAADMESGDPGWIHDPVQPHFRDQWHLSEARNHTPDGQFSWKCGDIGNGDYADSLDAGLITPVFFIGPDYLFEFRHWMDAQVRQGQPLYAYDGGLVELSFEGGPFEAIPPVDGYPSFIIEGGWPGPFPFGTPVYSGNFDWSRAVFDLGGYEGDAQLRFRFGSDGTVTGEGWYVDDLIVHPSTVSDVEPGERVTLSPAPGRLCLFPPHPNPANPRTTLRFALPEAGPVAAVVYDVRGRLVRVLLGGKRFAGIHEITWDGRDDAGRPTASGVYFCRLSSGGRSETRRLVLAR